MTDAEFNSYVKRATLANIGAAINGEALPGAWAALTNEQRIELMALCCSSCGAMDPRCRCGDDS